MKFRLRQCIVLSFFCILYIQGNAQQQPQYNQYLFNLSAINPAFAGSKGHLTTSLISRYQWVKINNAPQTHTFNIQSPFKKNALGVGGTVISDRVGPYRHLAVNVDLSYHLFLNDKWSLGMGLKSGINSYRADLTGLENTSSTDDAFNQTFSNEIVPNFGFGMYTYTEQFFLGVSIPHIFENLTTSDQFSFFNERRTFYVNSGLAIDLPNKRDQIQPTILFEGAAGAPLAINAGLAYIYKQKLSAGLNYRHDAAIGFSAQFDVFKNIWVGYAFEYPLSNLAEYTNGSHEFMIHYVKQRKQRNTRIRNPRFFYN